MVASAVRGGGNGNAKMPHSLVVSRLLNQPLEGLLASTSGSET